MVTVFSATQFAYGTQTDLKTRVAQQVERIKLISGNSENGYGELPGLFMQDDGAPVPQLIKYGMDAIPDSAVFIESPVTLSNSGGTPFASTLVAMVQVSENHSC